MDLCIEYVTVLQFNQLKLKRHLVCRCSEREWSFLQITIQNNEL